MRLRSSHRGVRSRLARAAYLLAWALALASIGSACGSQEGASTEPAASPGAAPGDAAPPAPGAAATEEPAGEAIATVDEVPAAYPSDLPVYPGATPGSAMTMPGLGIFATFTTSDSIEKVLEHYRVELAKNGWSVSDSVGGAGVDGIKGNRSVQVRAREEDGHSEIAVNLSES